MEWKIGELGKTKTSLALRNKFKKMFTSMGMHRDIDRLSKISDNCKLKREIEKVADREYPETQGKPLSAPEKKEKLEFVKNLYGTVAEKDFKKRNAKILKDMYKAFKKIYFDDVDKNDLSSDLANFYVRISQSKNYDDFVANVYRYISSGNNITNVADELIKLSVPKFELTYRDKDPIKLPKNVADIYSMVMLIRQKLSKVAAKVEQDYSQLAKEVEEFKSDNSVEESKKTEIVFAFGNKSPDKTVNFRIKQVDEVIDGLKKFNKQLGRKIKSSARISADIQNSNEGEVLGRLHMLLSPKSESSPEKVLKNATDDYSKIRAMMQKAKSKKGTNENNVRNEKIQPTRNRGGRVAELRKKFEGQGIMGVGRPKSK